MNISAKQPQSRTISQRDELIASLSDGQFHSGSELGMRLGMSRAAVWKYIKNLDGLGIDVDSVRGRGYRIAGGLDLLDMERIRSYMSQNARELLGDVNLFKTIDSTNLWLLDRIEKGLAQSGDICLAEQQSAGRGRRGRTWISPFGRNLYCSVVWRFDKGINALEGLSLAVAVAIIEALNELSIPDLSLKWPNDIQGHGKKVAGILLEVRGDLTDSCDVVVGIGLNFFIPPKAAREIDQAWTDLEQLTQKKLDRNQVSALVIEHVLQAFVQFDRCGFSVFLERWNRWDAYRGQTVSIIAGKDVQTGKAYGVNEQGVFLLETDKGIQTFHGGEVSLRRAHELAGK
jgi:BirA family transcriptional regulator, biotin operon repressor / biotin---[acetyl-CoA-carboxylase] ligase